MQDIRDEDPSDILEKEQLVEFSQLIYNTIFELKKRYFDALLYYKWAETFINTLFDRLNLSQKQREDLIATYPPPRIEDIPESELIQAIKNLQIEPPSAQGNSSR